MTVPSVRNCNPGNLRTGSPWRGLVPAERRTPEQRAETAFCVFVDAAHGFRAMAILLTGYDRMGFNTVSKILHRWAPPSENDTCAYIVAVATALRVRADEAIFVTDRDVLAKLLRAIATHETGFWPADWDAQLEQGLTLAGI